MPPATFLDHPIVQRAGRILLTLKANGTEVASIKSPVFYLQWLFRVSKHILPSIFKNILQKRENPWKELLSQPTAPEHNSVHLISASQYLPACILSLKNCDLEVLTHIH